MKTKFKVPFEELPSEPVIVTVGVRRWLVIGGVFLIFTILSLIGTINQPTMDNFYGFLIVFLLTAVSFFIYWRSVNTYHGYVSGEKEVLLFDNKPNEAEFGEFMQTLQESRTKYLAEKYGSREEIHIDTHPLSSPVQELEKLFELKNKGIIDEAEYETLKKKIIGGEQKRIGFFQE